MTIFLPKGVKSGGIIDPTELGDEFVRASVVAKNTSQYQWAKDTFDDTTNSKINVLKPGTPVIVTEVSQEAFLRYDRSGEAPKTDWADDPGKQPDLTVATGDLNLYHAPYNRGFSTITGDQDMEVSWTSEYPELVMVAFSFQFARKSNTTYETESGSGNYITPALQIRLSIDGGTVAGSGILNSPPTGTLRGQGYKNRYLRTTTIGMSMVPAGSHYLVAEAGQAPTDAATTVAETGSTISFDAALDEGVCIGHRSLILMRFPRGGLLGG